MTGLAMTGRQADTTSANRCVSLRGVKITARLAGMSVKALIEQTFVNQESVDIEAVYTFPLPSEAAVCHFEVVTDERVLTGKVEDGEKAIDQYEDAISQGDAAYLMEQVRPDVFTIRVGNIKPNQVATVRLTYVAPLEMTDGRIRLALPTTIAPRYVTDSGTDPLEAAMDGDALNPPHWLGVPYGLTLDVEIALGTAMRSITSPSHTLKVETTEESTDESNYRVTLSDGIAAMDRDVVIQLEPERDNEPCVQIGRGPDGATYAAVTFIPEFAEEDLAHVEPCETVFLLDCSGSMMGQSIQQAKQALQLCLRSLSEGDTFNIWRFGSTFEAMQPKPRQYGEDSLHQALNYLGQVDANLGGTELLHPLQKILAAEPTSGGHRQVIVLTDGQVSNEPAVVALAKKHAANNRIFTFGIGAASSSYLVKGLAKATGGAAEFIANNERIEDKVLRTFSRMASPQMTDVQVDWGGAEVQLTNSEMPPVFDGDAFRVVARICSELPQEVTLRGKTPHGEANWTVAVSKEMGKNDQIALEWGRQKIEDLEETDTEGRSAQSRTRKRLIDLSKQFNILCRHTSFIAIEHRSEADRNAGQPAVREVPVMLAQGWGGVEMMQTMYFHSNVLCESSPASTHRTRRFMSALPTAVGERRGGMPLCASDEIPPESPFMPESVDGVFTILQAQLSSGAFEGVLSLPAVSEPAAQQFSSTPKQLQQKLGEMLQKEGYNSSDQAVITVLVLVLLNSCYQDYRAIWKRAGSKAVRYLALQFGVSRSTVRQVIGKLSEATT
jgi:Ca-activated chloride channel family protein